MGVPRQLTQVAFAAPLDESTEDEILDPTVGFPVLENVRQDKRGGLSKRLGYESTDSLGDTGRRLFAHRDLACAIAADGALTVRDSAGNVVSHGRAPYATATARFISSPSFFHFLDACQCNGFTLAMTSIYRPLLTNSLITVTVETDGGAVVVQSDLGTVASRTALGQVVVIGTTVLAFYGSGTGATGNIMISVLDCTSVATIQAGWSTPAVAADDHIDILSAVTIGSIAIIAYVNDSGGASQLSLKAFDASGTLAQSSTVDTLSATPTMATVSGVAGNTLWVAWGTSGSPGTAYLHARSPTTISSITGATVSLGTAPSYRPAYVVTTAASQGMIALTGIYGGGSGSSFGASTIVRTASVSAGTITLGTAMVVGGAQVLFRPVLLADRLIGVFADVDMTNSTPTTYAVCDWTDTVTTGTMLPIATAFANLVRFQTSGGTGPGSLYANAFTTGTYTAAFPMTVTRSARSTSATLLNINVRDPAVNRTAYHNNTTVLSSGSPSYFDRRRVAELGYVHAPPAPLVEDSGSGTGPEVGDYNYVLTYEEEDATGALCISGVSTPTLATSAGDEMTIYAHPLSITARESGYGEPKRVRVVLWRSQLGGGAPYRLVGSVANEPSSGSITFTDALPEASIAGAQQLNGIGGNLPGTGGAGLQREGAPFAVDAVSYNGMAVIASGSELRWSGQTIDGEGTWFSAEFAVPVDGPGDITALAVLDGALYAFKERAIFAVSGDPPADNGGSGGLGQPRRISADVGCIQTNSIVSTSLGVFFRSHRGLELLGRGAPVWIGEKVQRTLALFPDVTSAVIDAHNNLVRFSLSNGYDNAGSVTAWNDEAGDDLGGRDLVFDLTLGDWQSVDDKSTQDSPHVASQDAAIIDGRYAWLASDGTLYTEIDEYLDDGQWITMLATTGWWKVSGIQGRQMFNRLLTLFRKHTSCDLHIWIGYEYRDEYATQIEKTNDETDDLIDLDIPLQLQVNGNDDAEGMAVRVRIVDEQRASDEGAPPIGTGRGATWLALTLDITPKEGAAEVPAEAA